MNPRRRWGSERALAVAHVLKAALLALFLQRTRPALGDGLFAVDQLFAGHPAGP